MTALRKKQVESTAEETPQSLALDSAVSEISHNLNGQRLGRKGRVTRERILAATVELLEGPDDEPISLSAVARKASLGMTSIYNYFSDLTELLLAVLEPVIASSEEAFMGMLRQHWPDDELHARCHEYVTAYYDFWARHSRLLHLRNSMSDNGDQRMLLHRVTSTEPMIRLIANQMDGVPGRQDSPYFPMASVITTAIERTATVTTDKRLANIGYNYRQRPRGQGEFLAALVRLLELAIRDTREKSARGEAGGLE